MPEDRRHIAVMFTDIVGVTTLTGSDEKKAFDLLRKNRCSLICSQTGLISGHIYRFR